MIWIYTGCVGSGKSYHALLKGLEYIKKRKYVVANFPIKISKDPRKAEIETEYWRYWDEITPERLIAFSVEKGFIGKESRAIVIIDEAGVIFNSRDWQVLAKERAKWIKFLSQSRKFGYDVILIAQEDRMIDRQIRNLAEFEVRHISIRNEFFWWLPLKVVVNYWYHVRMRGSVSFLILRKGIFAKYDTMKLFNIEDIKKEIRKIYAGKVIPANVAKFLGIIEAEKSEEVGV